MQGDKISAWEKAEITLNKFVTYIPVAITFGVFGFLFTFYTTVSTILATNFFRFFSILLLKEIFMASLGYQTCIKTNKKWTRKCWAPKFMAFCSPFLAWIFSFRLLLQLTHLQDPYLMTLNGICHHNNKTNKKPLMLMLRPKVWSWECPLKLSPLIEIRFKERQNKSKYFLLLNFFPEIW